MSDMDIAALFKAHRIHPFHRLSPIRLREATAALRLYQLDAAARQVLDPPFEDQLVLLLDGSVVCENAVGGRSMSHEMSRYPLTMTSDGPVLVLTASQASLVATIPSRIVDELLFWEQTAEATAQANPQFGRRMALVRDSLAFQDVPAALIPEIFHRMQTRRAQAGEEIVRQGEAADAYYLLSEGRAKVWETGVYEPERVKVNVLGPGDGFGEQAIITAGTRGATVCMVEDGEVLVLDQDDYKALVSDSSLTEIDASQTREYIDQGYRLLDVRFEEENEEMRIPNSRLIPLQRLRQRLHELDQQGRYVVYCRSGKRSAVASVILGQQGIEAVSMRGGLLAWPYATEQGW